MSATLAQLLSVRSKLADDLAAFLDADVAALDPLPYAIDGRVLTVRGVFFEPVVLLPEERQRARKPDGGEKEDDDAPGRGGFFEDMARPLYERERTEETNELQRWSQFLGPPGVSGGIGIAGRPVAVIGAPGGGKTCATRWAVIERAVKAAEDLRSGAALPDDIIMPLWVTATALGAVDGSAMPTEGVTVADAGEALLGAWSAQTGGTIPPAVRALFLRRLAEGRAFIVVDSLDEVPAQQDIEQRLTHRLKMLADSRARLIVTCRTKDWPARRGLAPFVADKPTELAPLRMREHHEFGRRFFSDTTRRADFERRLAASPSLRRTCETPLLLTYCALLFADGRLPQDATLAGIYEAILNSMMSGRWRTTPAPYWAVNEDLRNAVLHHLGAMAWIVFRERPEQNEFFHYQADDAFKKAGAPPLIRDSGDLNVPPRPLTLEADLLTGLRALGVLISASAGAGYSFGHRTIFEYLAAWHVHRDYEAARAWPGPEKPPPDWNAADPCRTQLHWVLTERKPFHFEPAWLQFLTFTASLLRDASPLLKALEREPENLLCTIFSLQCHLLAAAPRTPEEWAQKLASRWGDWRGYGQWEQIFEKTWLACGASLVLRRSTGARILAGFEDALDPQREPNESFRLYTAIALGRLGVAAAVPLLKNALDPLREPNANVRGFAARSLRTLGEAEAMPILKDALDPQREPNEVLRGFVAEELGLLGLAEAVPVLKDALDWHRELTMDERLSAAAVECCVNVRRAAAIALGRLGVAEAVPVLRDTLDPQREPVALVRSAAAAALGRLGVAAAMPVLRNALDPQREPAEEVRLVAAYALAALGVAETVPVLKNALDPQCEPNDCIRFYGVYALARSGGAEAVPVLKNSLDPQREPYKWVRKAAAEALGWLGMAEALPVLKDALDPQRERNANMRQAAAVSLGLLGLAEALPIIKEVLEPQREPDVIVCRLAAEALAAIAFRIEHAEHFRPGGKYAACLYEIPMWLKPPWK